MRDKRDKAVMGCISLYPDHWAFLQQYAADNGLASLKNKGGVNLSAALQQIIDRLIEQGA